MTTSLINICIRENENSNNMTTQLTWFGTSSMRKYQWQWKKVEHRSTVLSISWTTIIAAVILIWSQNMMQSISHVTKNVKGSFSQSNCKWRLKNAHSSLKVANDATIFASNYFPISVIDNILPSPLTIYLFLWQQSKFFKNIWHMNWLWMLSSITSGN